MVVGTKSYIVCWLEQQIIRVICIVVVHSTTRGVCCCLVFLCLDIRFLTADAAFAATTVDAAPPPPQANTAATENLYAFMLSPFHIDIFIC